MSRAIVEARTGRSGPAEHSVALRASAAGALCVAIAACTGQGELPAWFAALVAALACAGSLCSHLRRARPIPYLKLFLGAAMLGTFGWFFVTVSTAAARGRLSALEDPLAVLFSAMLAAHAFDMPARRDIGFSLAGSATLMAIAGAQATDLSFGAYVGMWAVLGLFALHASWSSTAGGSWSRPLTALVASASALLVAGLLVTFLPAPRPPTLSLAGAASTRAGQARDGTTSAADTTGQARVVPAPRGAGQRPASPTGPTGIGGFLGFAGPLDTALRPGLGNELVLRIRADRPSYWLAETYDTWSGRTWRETEPRPQAGAASSGAVRSRPWTVVAGGSPFLVGPGQRAVASSQEPGDLTRSFSLTRRGAADPDYQTFSLAAPASDLILHAGQAAVVWIPTRRLLVGTNGAIRTPRVLGAGSVYSVLSTVAAPSRAALSKANGTAGLTATRRHEDLQLPHPYPRVEALARRVTSHDVTVLSKITALEHWIGTHTTYTLGIPPLAPGQDAVDEFLFGTRRGFCEQISTALAVMLRTLGIPAREAVGYVPGHFDPITGVYDEEAKDAHAWVQVWFPRYGWQSFDPTADVPVANPSTASALRHALLAVVRRVVAAPGVALALLLALGAVALAWQRRRRRGWRTKVTRQLERAALHIGLSPGPGATLASLANALDDALGETLGDTPREVGGTAPSARALASLAARAAWGPDHHAHARTGTTTEAAGHLEGHQAGRRQVREAGRRQVREAGRRQVREAGRRQVQEARRLRRAARRLSRR